VDAASRSRLTAAVRGRVRQDVPLSDLCTYRVGGPAALLAEPADADDLAALLRLCHIEGWPTLALGGGSNLLVADSGFAGVAIRLTAPAFVAIETLGEGAVGPRLRVGGGLRVGRLVAEAVRRGWLGLAFLEGIPGTVGGAVRMNAGTRDGEVAGVLVDATLVLVQGVVETRPAESCGLSYRASALPSGAIVCSATLEPGRGSPDEVQARRRAHRQHRRKTQPTGHSAGSVFKNPPGDHAGRLLDAAGLKGARVGGARVSDVHANFILTETGATAAHVHALIRHCQATVEARFGVRLLPENVLVGFA